MINDPQPTQPPTQDQPTAFNGSPTGQPRPPALAAPRSRTDPAEGDNKGDGSGEAHRGSQAVDLDAVRVRLGAAMSAWEHAPYLDTAERLERLEIIQASAADVPALLAEAAAARTVAPGSGWLAGWLEIREVELQDAYRRMKDQGRDGDARVTAGQLRMLKQVRQVAAGGSSWLDEDDLDADSDDAGSDDLLGAAAEMARLMRDSTTILDETLQLLRKQQTLAGLQAAADDPANAGRLVPYICDQCPWTTPIDETVPVEEAHAKMLLALADHAGLVHPHPRYALGADQLGRLEAWLHGQRLHPDWEYETTTGPRKQWDDADRPPPGDDWRPNVEAGQDGWERFEYHEEAYWRRPRRVPDVGCTRACNEAHTYEAGCQLERVDLRPIASWDSERPVVPQPERPEGTER